VTQPKKVVSYADAKAIIALPKFIVGDVEWKQQPEGSELFTADLLLLNQAQQTIPGLTVELQYRRGIVNGECKCLFTVFLFEANKLRAYQLEVVPQHRSKHAENGVKWYGPHKHIGDKSEQVKRPDLCCDDHAEWFAYFLNDANIKHVGNYAPPNPPDPQLVLGLE
jgi:hypothetical protein